MGETVGDTDIEQALSFPALIILIFSSYFRVSWAKKLLTSQAFRVAIYKMMTSLELGKECI